MSSLASKKASVWSSFFARNKVAPSEATSAVAQKSESSKTQGPDTSSEDAFLDDELIAKIRGIQMKAKHLVNDAFAGGYQSAFKGHGLEFEEVREYFPGDDIRAIDWNVTARAGRPFIKLYRDERELTVMFMVDVSASARFGSKEKFKHEIAAEITALLAYSALRNSDKVGLIVFSDRVEHYLPPKKGRGHIWRLIRDILTYKAHSLRTDLEVPLDFLNQIQRRRAVVFLMSDFQIEDLEPLRITSRRHNMIAISIADQRETTLPKMGYINLVDKESGQSLLVNTNAWGLQKKMDQAVQKERQNRLDFFRSAGIDYLELDTDESYIDHLVKYFRAKGRA